MHLLTFLLGLLLLSPIADAQEARPLAHMQQCRQNGECVFARSRCDDCTLIPLNRTYAPTFSAELMKICAGEIKDLRCSIHPAANPVCINGRCTLDYAYEEHADPADYLHKTKKPGELITDDLTAAEKSGRFTAYDLDEGEVVTGNIGQLRIRPAP